MSASVSYSARLDLRRETVLFVARVLVLRWFLHATRMRQPADDHGIGLPTCYRYPRETINALAERAPTLGNTVLTSRFKALRHISLDLWHIGAISRRPGTPSPRERPDPHNITQRSPLWLRKAHSLRIRGGRLGMRRRYCRFSRQTTDWRSHDRRTPTDADHRCIRTHARGYAHGLRIDRGRCDRQHRIVARCQSL